MWRTTRRPLAADGRVERLESEETEVHRVYRYEGADPTTELHTSVRILNWMCCDTGSLYRDLWNKGRYVSKLWETTNKAGSSIEYWLKREMFREDRLADNGVAKVNPIVQISAWTRALNSEWRMVRSWFRWWRWSLPWPSNQRPLKHCVFIATVHTYSFQLLRLITIVFQSSEPSLRSLQSITVLGSQNPPSWCLSSPDTICL